MGRYYRGDQCDTVYAFPDYDSGVKCVLFLFTPLS